MYPILFKIGNITLYTYGLFVGLGFLTAVWYAGRQARKNKIPPEIITDLFFVILLSSLAGARLFYVLLNFSMFKPDLLSIFKIWKGGLVFYGGFVCALGAAVIFARIKNLPLWKTADIIAPAIALGHAVGRMGCFFAGCCYGRQCDLPWAVTFHNPDSLAPLNVQLHPTQLYSVLSNLLIFLILLLLDKGIMLKKGPGEQKVPGHFPGMIFWVYIFLYGIFRSFLEMFRGDDRGHFLVDFLSVSQGIGIFMSFFALFMLVYLKLGSNREKG